MKEIYILFVDQNENNFYKIEKLLEASEYKGILKTAKTFSEFKEILTKFPFNIILTDIKIEDKNYFDVFNFVTEKKLETPVVLFSDEINLEIAIYSTKNGINDYIKKTIPDRIVAIINRELREADARIAKKMAEEAVYYMAYHDPLTGLSNRYEFEGKLNEILNKVKENSELEYSLLYMDLDQFKIVNDTCGHQAGDDLLRLVSVAITQVVKKEGFSARIGGDEFVVVLNEKKIEESTEIANELIKKISAIRFHFEDKIFTIGASIGLLQIKETHSSISEIMSLADVACYSAKDSGRNQVYVSFKNDKQSIFRMEEMNWSTKLKTSIELNQFTLFKQPIVSLPYSGDSRVFYEFLLRLKSDTKGLVMPDVFMRAAERYNMMPSLDRWVINHAFQYIDKKRELISSFPKKPIFFINLSGASLSDPTFFDFIEDKMTIFKIDPSLICFEITETVAISNINRTVTFIEEIRKKGSNFALDDFGAGMSSFAYLKSLPVDFLKIDGAFIRDMTIDSLDYAIVESIQKVAKAVGLTTIAEFVENLTTLDLLKKIGIDYAQGYAISYPNPIDKE